MGKLLLSGYDTIPAMSSRIERSLNTRQALYQIATLAVAMVTGGCRSEQTTPPPTRVPQSTVQPLTTVTTKEAVRQETPSQTHLELKAFLEENIRPDADNWTFLDVTTRNKFSITIQEFQTSQGGSIIPNEGLIARKYPVAKNPRHGIEYWERHWISWDLQVTLKNPETNNMQVWVAKKLPNEKFAFYALQITEFSQTTTYIRNSSPEQKIRVETKIAQPRLPNLTA